MPNYTREGKIQTPLSDEDFKEGMEKGQFLKPKHRGFCVLLYYSAVRKAEALRVRKEQFHIAKFKRNLLFDVGPRMKKQKHLKVCPRCKAKYGQKALECKRCGMSLENVPISLVGKPLTTPYLTIPMKAPYVMDLVRAIANTPNGERVFPYSARTGYNIVRRAFKYPHFFRLSRITNFFLDGWSIAEVKSWTGLTLWALESYVGLANVAKMGESLGRPKK